MYHLISPNILNENSFEYLISQLPRLENITDKDILLDLNLTESIDAYGILGILELGIYLKKNHFNTYLNLPKDEEALSFIYDSDFLKFASLGFNECIGKQKHFRENKNILLNITPVEKSQDIHNIASKIRENVESSNNPENKYNWDNIIVIISEICQNIPEHSQDKGFVLVCGSFCKASRKTIITIVVMDLGIGIRSSLEKKFLPIFRERWSDHLALHKTLFEGVSRYDDPGRGQGIIQTRQMVVDKYKGNMSLRSGTAKLWSKIPSWEMERFFRKSLTFFPGTQVNINIPI